MKRFLALFFAIVLVITLVSCGKKKSADKDPTDDSAEATDTLNTEDDSDVFTDAPGVPTDIPLPSQDTYVPESASPDNPIGNRPQETASEGGYDTDVALGSFDEEFTPEIKNDEQTITWVSGPTTHKVTHDGTNVLSYATYTDYGTNDLAEQLYNSYVDLGPELGDSIKTIERKGTIIIIEYNEEGLITLEKAKEEAALFATETK